MSKAIEAAIADLLAKRNDIDLLIAGLRKFSSEPDGPKEKPESERPKRGYGRGTVYRKGNLWWIRYNDKTGKRISTSTGSADYYRAERMLDKIIAERDGKNEPIFECADCDHPDIYHDQDGPCSAEKCNCQGFVDQRES